MCVSSIVALVAYHHATHDTLSEVVGTKFAFQLWCGAHDTYKRCRHVMCRLRRCSGLLWKVPVKGVASRRVVVATHVFRLAEAVPRNLERAHVIGVLFLATRQGCSCFCVAHIVQAVDIHCLLYSRNSTSCSFTT